MKAHPTGNHTRKPRLPVDTVDCSAHFAKRCVIHVCDHQTVQRATNTNNSNNTNINTSMPRQFTLLPRQPLRGRLRRPLLPLLLLLLLLLLLERGGCCRLVRTCRRAWSLVCLTEVSFGVAIQFVLRQACHNHGWNNNNTTASSSTVGRIRDNRSTQSIDPSINCQTTTSPPPQEVCLHATHTTKQACCS